MTRLNELINELCPDGVEYKTLGELGEFYGGITGKTKDDFVDGNEKFITYMNVYKNIKLNLDVSDKVKISPDEKQRTLEYGDVLFTGSSETPDECGISSVLADKTDEKLYLNSFCICYRFNDSSLFNPEFSKYLFRSDELRKQIKKTASGVTRFNVSKEKMKKVKIPVPPLPVQEEIVRILDKFTSLEAELEARRVQYEYYRDELLTRETKIQIKTLGEVCEIGVGDKPKSILESKTEYEYINAGTTNSGYTDCSNCKGDTVTTPSRGLGGIGFIGYQKKDFYLGPLCYKIRSKNIGCLLNKYLFYYLQSNNEKILKIRNSGGVPSVNRSDLVNISISIPPLEVQKRIVNVLDNFDAICSDLRIGLPAEIEARKKQYEYYRDLLLTFAERGKTIFTEQNRTEQNRTEQNRTEQNRTEQNRTDEIRLLQYVFGYAEVRLGEICQLYAGATPSTKKPEYWENGIIPWMSSGEVNLGQVFATEKKITQLGYDKCSTKMVPANTVVVALAGQGKTRGTVAITRIPLCTNQSLCSILPNEMLDSYYLYFYMKGQYEELRRISSGEGTRGGLNLKMLSDVQIPLPPLAEQERIVKILDRFESLCNDISAGLPAEIKMRRKQYEFYRDKLLSFKEKAN